MVKKLFETVLIILLPTLLIVSIYRYCLGYNPLNFKATIDIIGDSFTDSSSSFVSLIQEFSSIYEEAVSISLRSVHLNTDVEWFNKLANGLISSIISVGLIVFNLFDIVRLSLKFALVFCGDIVNALVLLTHFFVDSSPYVVSPYFPG